MNALVIAAFAALSVSAASGDVVRKISTADFRDRMMGAWIGQSVGVAYGWPTEFKWKGRLGDETELPVWKPESINETFSQDDLYVEMTFMSTMLAKGVDVGSRDAGIDFANSTYRLWCANDNARNNLRNGIAAPASSHPEFHRTTDDIDYQIESDFSGILAPGMPQASVDLGETFGRIMNYGDGLYAGQFVGAMYAEAYFVTDRVEVVERALRAIPSESRYAEMVRDMLAWYRSDPKDWKGAWRKAVDKYQSVGMIGKVSFPAIDVKINGAMALLGFLFGEGDMERTMRIATSGGYDSDCNPSTACGVLGTMIGMNRLDPKYFSALSKTNRWEFTDFDWDGLVAASEKLTRKIVLRYGGSIDRDGSGVETFVIPVREVRPSPFFDSRSPDAVPSSTRLSREERARIRYLPCEKEGAQSVPIAAWFYPQMDLEIYRLNKMREESENVGMRAAHPGEVAELRDHVEFRRKKDDGSYETQTIWPRYRQPACVRSDADGWEAKTFDGEWHVCSKYPDSAVPPHSIDIPTDRSRPPLRFETKGGYYDAGEETLAYIECESETCPAFRVGESLAEVAEKDPEKLEYAPRMVQVDDNRWRTPVPYAFRYLRFGEGQQKLDEVKLVTVGRKYEKCGGFKSDNERWNRMFEVGRRTLYLCSQDFLIDGIKRDRLPWAGDLSVSLMANAYVYGDAEIVRRSLSIMDAYLGDVNGITPYSMWTIIGHDMYQLYFGDRDFLNERWWRVKWRIENLVSRCDGRGFVTKGLDWVFVDWTDDVDPCALQMIWVGALDAAAKLAARVNDQDAEKYRALAAKVRGELNAKHWDDQKGVYGIGRHASVYAVIFGVADAEKTKRIGANLAKDEIAPVGTPYVYGWELIALKRAGYTKEFFAGLEKVFGAMLDQRETTTFWEGYDAKEKGVEMYRFYGRPFAKSLCHVWSAWPAFLFVSEVMGVKPTSDGWKTYEANPLPGLTGLHATIHTPRGMLEF